jgi:hypothetical protein
MSAVGTSVAVDATLLLRQRQRWGAASHRVGSGFLEKQEKQKIL